ncbi:hypothetical protein [Myxosarcina sp. GI1(2024)]
MRTAEIFSHKAKEADSSPPSPAGKILVGDSPPERSLVNGTIINAQFEYDPSTTTTIGNGVGKCPNCNTVIEDDVIKSQAQSSGLGHQLYAVAYKEGQGSLRFRIPTKLDLEGIAKAEAYIEEKLEYFKISNIIPEEQRFDGYADRCIAYGLSKSLDYFNPRQLLTLVTYVEIINEAKSKLQIEYELEKVEAITTYLSFILDRCVDKNCRLAHWIPSRISAAGCSGQHSLNLFWSYPEYEGSLNLWQSCRKGAADDFSKLCKLYGTKSNSITIPGLERYDLKSIQIDAASADSLFHIADKSVDTIVTDPPYYSTLQCAELSDFFYVWQKRTLGDIFPDLFWSELTDKDREAVARFC